MKFKTMLWSLLAVLVCSLGSVGCSDDDDPVVPPTPEAKDPVLTISQSVIEAASEGGVYSVNINLENPVQGQVVEASTSADWISGFEASATAVKFNVAANADAAREAQVTLKYKGAQDARFTVKQAGKQGGEPETGDGPKLDLKAHYEASSKMLCVDMVCTSKDATKAVFGIVMADELDELLNNGEPLENILDPANGVTEELDAELLGILNGEGFVDEALVAWNAQIAGKNVAVLLQAFNANGSTYVRSDALIEEGEAPAPGEGPALEFKGLAADGQVAFFARSATKNVAKGEIFLADKSAFEQALSQVGDDLNNLADALAGSGQQLNPQWVDLINSDEGLQLNLNEVDPSVLYASLITVFDAENHRTVAYATAEPDGSEPQPQEGSLAVEFKVDASSDAFSVFAICTSKNASEAHIAWNEPAVLDEMIAGGATLEKIMDETIKGGKAQKFESSWVKSMNSAEGISLTLGAEPNVSLGFLLNVMNADARVVKRADATTPEPYTGPSYVKALTDADFKDLVWDFDADTQFKFKGNKPCVLDFGAPAWCGWCVKLEPVMNEASALYKDQIDFYTIDIDYHAKAHQKMAALTGAGNGVPLLIMVTADGKYQVVGGYIPLTDMKNYCNQMLGKASPRVPFALNASLGMAQLEMPVRHEVAVNKISLPLYKNGWMK